MIFARHFLKITNDELGKNIKGFSNEVENIFRTYVWPGNLRELKNVVKRATLLADTEYINALVLPFEITNFTKLQFGESKDEVSSNIQIHTRDIVAEPSVVSFQPSATIMDTSTINRTIELNEHSLKGASIDAEYELIVEALRKANFNKSKAAKILNVDRKTLYNKMKQYKQFNSET